MVRRHDLVPRALASHHRPLSRGEGRPRGLGPQLPLTLPWLGESRLLWLPKPRPSGRVLSRRPEAGERWPRARGISHPLPLRPLCAPSQSRKKPSESREQGTTEVRTELPSPKHRWEDGRDRAGAARHRQHRPHRRPLRPRPPRAGPHGVGWPAGRLTVTPRGASEGSADTSPGRGRRLAVQRGGGPAPAPAPARASPAREGVRGHLRPGGHGDAGQRGLAQDLHAGRGGRRGGQRRRHRRAPQEKGPRGRGVNLCARRRGAPAAVADGPQARVGAAETETGRTWYTPGRAPPAGCTHRDGGPARSGADSARPIPQRSGESGSAPGAGARGSARDRSAAAPERRTPRLPPPLPLRPVDAGRGVQGEVWPVPSVTETSPGPGEATGHNDQDVLGSETLGLQPSSAAMAP